MDLQEQGKAGGGLDRAGGAVSASTVGRLLHGLGFRLHALQKAREGAAHPDRNAQFDYINTTATAFIHRQQPVISVDTKKKALVGDFKTAGREWQPIGEPERVRVHDFPGPRSGKRFPTASTTWRAMKPGSASAAITTRRRSRSRRFGSGGR